MMMDRFLVFFQYYALCKEELLIDAKIELADTLDLIRPQKTGVYRRLNKLEQARDACEKILRQEAKMSKVEESK